MLPRNVNKTYLSGRIWEHWRSFVRLSAFIITCNAIVADKVNFLMRLYGRHILQASLLASADWEVHLTALR
jgi:hypothetical protein